MLLWMGQQTKTLNLSSILRKKRIIKYFKQALLTFKSNLNFELDKTKENLIEITVHIKKYSLKFIK